MEWRLDFYVSVPPSGTAQCLMLQYLFCLRGCCHSGAPPVIIPKGVGSSPSSPTCPVFLDTRPAAIQALLVGARRKLILPIQFKDAVLIFFLIIYLELNAAGTLTSLWIGLTQPGKRSFPCKPQKGTYMQDPRVALSIFFSLRGQAISLTWEEQDFFLIMCYKDSTEVQKGMEYLRTVSLLCCWILPNEPYQAVYSPFIETLFHRLLQLKKNVSVSFLIFLYYARAYCHHSDLLPQFINTFPKQHVTILI